MLRSALSGKCLMAAVSYTGIFHEVAQPDYNACFFLTIRNTLRVARKLLIYMVLLIEIKLARRLRSDYFRVEFKLSLASP